MKFYSVHLPFFSLNLKVRGVQFSFLQLELSRDALQKQKPACIHFSWLSLYESHTMIISQHFYLRRFRSLALNWKPRRPTFITELIPRCPLVDEAGHRTFCKSYCLISSLSKASFCIFYDWEIVEIISFRQTSHFLLCLFIT